MTVARPDRSLRQVQAITFDVGGTLIEPWPSVGHIYAEVAALHGCRDLSAEALNRNFRVAWRKQEQFNHTCQEWAKLVDETFGNLIDTPPSRTFFDELYVRFSEPEAWRVFDDAVPALRALASRGLKLGVISNWDERLAPLLERLKLSGHFESVIVSYQAGAAKPSPAIFARAAREFGLPANAILHVGDSAEMDERGATGAGFQAVLLRRDGVETGAGQIKSLSELEALLFDSGRRWNESV